MRKINMSWQSVLLSVALLGLAACTGDFEDINRNPNQVTEEQMDALNYKTGTKFKVAAESCDSRAGAHVPVQRIAFGRAVRRLHRCYGRYMADQVRDL